MKVSVKWLSLIIVCVGIFMSTLDGSILNIANPAIAETYGADMQQVQWVVTSYMLVITSSLLLLGKLGDRVGGHHIYTWGFLIFTTGSLGCSMAPSLAWLVAARCFQAIGASMLMATGIGIVSNSFPDEERGKALGFTGAVVGLGNMMGPGLGGWLVGSFSWPIIFVINIPVGLLAFFFSYRYLPRQDISPVQTGHDKTGNGLFALSLFLLVFAISLPDGIQPLLLAAGLGLLFFFYFFERPRQHPMLDFELLNNRIFIIGNLLGLAAYMTQIAVAFLLPFYLESLLNMSPVMAGLLLTIPPAVQIITAPLAGSLSDRLGPPRLTSVAFLLMSLGYLILSSLGSTPSMPRIVVGLFIFGVGVASFGSPNSSSIMGATPRDKAGYAGGFIATVRNLSFSLGVAVWVRLFTWSLNSNQGGLPFTEAYANATSLVYLCAAAIAIAGLVLSLATSGARQNHYSKMDV